MEKNKNLVFVLVVIVICLVGWWAYRQNMASQQEVVGGLSSYNSPFINPNTRICCSFKNPYNFTEYAIITALSCTMLTPPGTIVGSVTSVECVKKLPINFPPFSY